MIILGLFLPFVGTALGAAMVFFMRSRLQSALHQFLLGFACGVMLAASIWSLLLPSLALAEGCRLSFLPASIGFLCGIAFLIFLEHLTERLPSLGEVQSPVGGSFRQTMLLVLAVTLHNIPEGMAVGVALAAARENAGIAMSGALALSAGIAIQNLPEGAIIAMPLRSEGYSKGASFGCGVLSGVVEPVFGALTLLFTAWITAALPYLLSFAAGAMVYVVAADLLPEAQREKPSFAAMCGLAAGFVLMMILDVCLS